MRTVALALVLLGCGGPQARKPTGEQSMDLRKVDWNNYTYRGMGPGGVTLQDGRYEYREYLEGQPGTQKLRLVGGELKLEP